MTTFDDVTKENIKKNIIQIGSRAEKTNSLFSLMI